MPKDLYTAAQVRQLDALAIQSMAAENGYELMQRAGRSAFRALMRRWPEAERLTLFCGGGNNGGDGYVVAELALRHNLQVEIFALSDPQNLQGEAAQAFASCRAAGVDVTMWSPVSSISGDIIVDAMLGTGLSGEVRDDYAAAITAINAAGKPIIALDIPSGLCADTGMPLGATVNAAMTVTFIGMKRGLLTGEAPDYAGELVFDELDAPTDIYSKIPPACRRSDFSLAVKLAVARKSSSHKGMFGRVLVVGGDSGFGGAAIMAAEAAYRAGCGLVSCATRAAHVGAGLSRLPEVMFREINSRGELLVMLESADVIALGPGLGKEPWGQMCLQTCLDAGKPMVVDADALNMIAARKHQLSPHSLMTPHPGEAARLLECSVADVMRDRFAAARDLAKTYNCHVLLKGVGTVLAAPDQEEQVVVQAGNPGMACGGMGDVLTGLAAGLLAQGMKPLAAAELAAAWHGAAADSATESVAQASLMAGDLLKQLGSVMREATV
ncbi:NAD(P)H-hydrate dehydratase [Hahella sp. KA22]|uniref:NAD(P)H-hydrate dehydratase n=1 Tax=Hahella sp. KA22 TaxID=1628392 RepID=UPI000FDE758C|nr:NAD(P)H-hydrate dehydratase [Hahella sp. KA22]AZZ90799.1 NAD(P)H-hydrate dehydratase [Hahella sp. KA22]QAY54169.1 NAD(P)H-hydrate dehydratase [Hahella sp. KA22]